MTGHQVSWRRRKKVARLLPLQDMKCWWCAHPFQDCDAGWQEPTLDHLVPKAKGGGLNDENLVVACKICNQRRQHDAWSPHPEMVTTERFKLLFGWKRRESKVA